MILQGAYDVLADGEPHSRLDLFPMCSSPDSQKNPWRWMWEALKLLREIGAVEALGAGNSRRYQLAVEPSDLPPPLEVLRDLPSWRDEFPALPAVSGHAEAEGAEELIAQALAHLRDDLTRIAEFIVGIDEHVTEIATRPEPSPLVLPPVDLAIDLVPKLDHVANVLASLVTSRFDHVEATLATLDGRLARLESAIAGGRKTLEAETDAMGKTFEGMKAIASTLAKELSAERSHNAKQIGDIVAILDTILNAFRSFQKDRDDIGRPRLGLGAAAFISPIYDKPAPPPSSPALAPAPEHVHEPEPTTPEPTTAKASKKKARK